MKGCTWSATMFSLVMCQSDIYMSVWYMEVSGDNLKDNKGLVYTRILGDWVMTSGQLRLFTHMSMCH